ncbi:hypothetical protein AC249_AIPGENE247 [Exaiptasia diaphana]|nr:hypothetical protein AC249_AIPGENE247 [Exaiptasia diaphana]
MNLTLYLCLAAVCFVTVSKACSCVTRDTSTPEFLCCNDYVLRGTVVKSVVTGNKSRPESQERVFTVKVQEIFKGKEKIKDIAGDTSQVNISTAVQSATCGTNIPSNKDYLISGKKLSRYQISVFRKRLSESGIQYMLPTSLVSIDEEAPIGLRPLSDISLFRPRSSL